uniref:hypothetical protein n=1 Tax=Gemmiger formicilis TaxID=745368 RepID=UPI0040284CD4
RFSSKISFPCSSIFTYFLDIAKPPRVVLLSYTGRLFVYYLLFTDLFKSSTLWGAALFVLHGFYGAVKERIRTARAPRLASRGAETPRWGVSRARLGEFLPVAPKSALPCTFAMRFLF